ncbi:MAG: hypothetical protein ACT4PJ_10815 [Gemmatimonadaceae bacterium]
MLSRIASAAIGAFVIPSAPAADAQSSSFTYAPGAHTYRVESSAKVSQEMNGQTIDGELNTRHLLTLDISRKAKDTLAIAYTWDSANVKTTGPIPAPDLAKVSGTRSSGFASPTGRMYSFNPGEALAEGLPAMEEFENFLPVVSAVNRKAGDKWVDTVTVNGNRGGIDVNTTIIVTSTFDGDTTYAGEKSWRIRRNLAFTVAGSGAAENTAMVIEGTGTGERTDYITSQGVYLGSALTQTAKSTISLPANNMTIPMTTTVTSTVQRVKG